MIDATELTLKSAPVLVIRRNAPARLAGLGYAAIMALWLGLYLAQPERHPLLIVVILTAMLLSGIWVALIRDDVLLDAERRELVLVQGFAGARQTRRICLSDVRRVAVTSTPVLRSGEETNIVHRHRLAVDILGEGDTLLLRMWEAEGEDESKLRGRAEVVADRVSSLLRAERV